MAQHHHMTEIRRRATLHKRQRPAVTEEDPTTTVPRVGRPFATTIGPDEVETEQVEEETEAPRRPSRPRPTEVEETSETPIVGAPTPAQATQITTTDEQEPLVTAAVPTTAPVAPVITTSESLTPVAPVVPTTRSSIPTTSSIRTSSTPSSSLLPSPSSTSSRLPVASAADRNAAAKQSEDGDFPTGTVVGVIVAVVAVIALLVGFLIWRKKRRSRSDEGLDAAMGGYTREKSTDNDFGVIGEKPQDYSMQAIPPNVRNSLQQHGAPLPSPIAMPVQQRTSWQPAQPGFNAPQHQPGFHMPQSTSMPNGFAPPKAAMMGSPSIRSSVASPYGLVAAAGLSSPPQQHQEENSPFEDPQWANKLFTVNRTFEPSMPDELVIYPGDTVRILMAYDDGWVLGENLSAVQDGVPVRGVFPRDCVEDSVEAQPQQQMQMDENVPLQQESTLTRAPTLPPLNLGRESQSFQTSMAPNRQSIASVAPSTVDRQSTVTPDNRHSTSTVPTPNNRSSIVSMHQQHLQRQSRQSLAPVIAIEEEPHTSEGHLSTSSSLNGAIDRFPNTPSRQLTPVVENDGASTRSLKRTSSLMASKDQDLFAQLGQVMQGDLDDEKEDEKEAKDETK